MLIFGWICCLVEIMKMKYDQDFFQNLWYDLKKFLWLPELNSRVRCAFGNVLQLVTFHKVSLRLCLFKLALRYVIYVPVFFLVHPPKACPGSQCMCVHEERYWLQFLKHLEIMRQSFLIIFQTCEIFFLSISEVCTTCLPIRGQPASRWVLLHTIII